MKVLFQFDLLLQLKVTHLNESVDMNERPSWWWCGSQRLWEWNLILSHYFITSAHDHRKHRREIRSGNVTSRNHEVFWKLLKTEVIPGGRWPVLISQRACKRVSESHETEKNVRVAFVLRDTNRESKWKSRSDVLHDNNVLKKKLAYRWLWKVPKN